MHFGQLSPCPLTYNIEKRCGGWKFTRQTCPWLAPRSRSPHSRLVDMSVSCWLFLHNDCKLHVVCEDLIVLLSYFALPEGGCIDPLAGIAMSR